jgi:hypothetical protein
MKKINIIIGCAAFIALATISGCKKKRAIVEWDMNYSTSYVFGSNSSPNTMTAGVNNFTASPVVTNISTSLENNRVNGNIVGEITLTNFSMNIKGPSGTNVKACKEYEFWMQAGTQKDVRVAYCNPWPSGTTTTQTVITLGPSTNTAMPVAFNLEGTNLKNYFLESNINMKMKAWADYTVASTYTVNATYTVHVKGIEQ